MKIIKLIGINILIFLAVLVIIELVFGRWFLKNQISELYIPVNVHYKYNVRDLYKTSKEYIEYKRDQYGLRGTYDDVGKIDILTLGGSTTDQGYIGDGETWQDVIKKKFEAAGRHVNIVNAGVDGQSTYGNIKDFDLWFPKIENFKSKYILVYTGVNDCFTDSSNSNSYDDLMRYPPIKAAIKSKSVLFQLYKKMRGIYLARLYKLSHDAINFGSLEWTEHSLVINPDQLMRERLESYDHRLRVLNEKIREFGAIPIFVTQPSRLYKFENGKLLGVANKIKFEGVEINGVDNYFLLDLINRKTMEVCGAIGGMCLDLARAIVFEDSDFYDYYHNTPSGAKKIGDYLYGKLKGKFLQ